MGNKKNAFMHHADVALVTGACGGIGREIAVGLAETGFNVILTCRPTSVDRCANETASLWKERGVAERTFVVEAVDFADCTSVASFVARVRKGWRSRLRVLVNNAAIMPGTKREVTRNGMESTFQVNVLGYFSLMVALHPVLAQNAPSSVVNVASDLSAPPQLDDVEFARRPWNKGLAYGESKAFVQALTWEFAARYNGSRVAYNALHPGATHTQMNHGHSRDSARSCANHTVWLAANAAEAGLSSTWWMMTRLAGNERRSIQRKKLYDPPSDVRAALWAYCESAWATCISSSSQPVASARGPTRHGRDDASEAAEPLHLASRRGALSVYEREGFVVLRNVFTTEEIVAIRNTVVTYLKQNVRTSESSEAGSSQLRRRISMIDMGGWYIADFPAASAALSKVFSDYLGMRRIQAVLHDLFGSSDFSALTRNEVYIDWSSQWHMDALHADLKLYNAGLPDVWKRLPNNGTHHIITTTLYLQDHSRDTQALTVRPCERYEIGRPTRNASTCGPTEATLQPSLGDLVFFDSRIFHRGQTRDHANFARSLDVSHRIAISVSFGLNNAFSERWARGFAMRNEIINNRSLCGGQFDWHRRMKALLGVPSSAKCLAASSCVY